MAAKIQVARGNISQKTENPGWAEGELFWGVRTSDPNASSEFSRWDEGTLYLGRPSLNGKEELPIAIGGARANQATVYRGTLTDEVDIHNDIFNHARKGDLYSWTCDAKSGTFHTVDDFRKFDLLLITSVGDDSESEASNIDKTSGNIIDHNLIQYIRINSSGGYADDVYFRKSLTENWEQFKANEVESALRELQFEKLEYAGIINAQSAIPANPVIGGLYLVTADDIVFTDTKTGTPYTADKGDFVYWRRDIFDKKVDEDGNEVYNSYWVGIPSGYTNADEIDYYDKDRILNGQKETFIASLFNTFDDRHKNLFINNSANVHTMLDFLMSQKAQLDEQGKVPLSQLHDTVLGAMQFRGRWNPVVNHVISPNEYTTTDGKVTVVDPLNKLYSLPGYSHYEDGDSIDATDDPVPQPGDYYIVEIPGNIANLQYTDPDGLYKDTFFELNTGDWIVYVRGSAKDVPDDTSAGVHGTVAGHWEKIDNSDRLTALRYNIDTVNKDGDFWIDHITNYTLTAVADPMLSASHKIGLEFLGNNEVQIVGKNLIDQLEYEDSLTSYVPRYANNTGTIENSFIEDKVITDGVEHIHDSQTKNKTVFHSNVDIGVRGEERRDTQIFGNVYIAPHLVADIDDGAVTEKGFAEFEVVAGGITRHVQVFAQDGTNRGDIPEDVSDVNTFIALPEHTSTLVGKLSGIEFERGRVTKSVAEGYIESTSIEEHINSSTSTGNYHDSISNVVEFHSQVSAPVENTFEIWFGDYDTTNGKNYTNENFNNDGSLVTSVLARLNKNKYQVEANVYIALPCESGTLLTQENIIKLYNGSDDDSYLPMFGDTITLDKEGKKFNTLQRSPIRQIKNALRTRLTDGHVKADEYERTISETFAKKFAKDNGTDIAWANTTNPILADTVIENDLIVGQFDEEGNLINQRSIIATKALGVSNGDKASGFIRPARTNFPNAPQYINPYTGEYNPEVDVEVDMPNESGVLLTSNSVVDGGVYNR